MDEGHKPGFFGRVVLLVQWACAVILGLASGLLFFAAVAITIRQAMLWLKTGVWVSQPTSTYISLPPDFLKNWVGARAIADWFIGSSIQGTLILCSLLGLFLMAKFIVATEPKRPNPGSRGH